MAGQAKEPQSSESNQNPPVADGLAGGSSSAAHSSQETPPGTPSAAPADVEAASVDREQAIDASPDTGTERSTLFDERPFERWLEPQKRQWVTFALIALNLLVFLVMGLTSGGEGFSNDPSPALLLNWGADWPVATINGQYWRLLTAGFVHIGWLHIGVNMFVLWTIGKFSERLLGHTRYLFIYLLSIVGGSIASNIWCLITPTNGISAGASGAICGLIGVLFAAILSHKHEMDTRHSTELIQNVGKYALVVIIVYGLLIHANNVAHIGGAATGFVLGWLLMPHNNKFKIGARDFSMFAICAGLFVGTIVWLQSTVLGYVGRASDDARAGDFEAMLAEANKAKAHNSMDPGASQLKAYADAALGNCDDAVLDCLALEELKSDYPRSIKIHALIGQGRYEQARTEIAHLEQSDVDPQALEMEILRATGKADQLKEVVDQRLPKNPADKNVLASLYWLQWRAGDYKAAMQTAKAMCGDEVDLSPVFMYTIASKRAKLDDYSLLVKYQKRIDVCRADQNVADFLRGKISGQQLVSEANCKERKGEAGTVFGLQLITDGKPEEAKKYLQWSLENGYPGTLDACLARVDSDRLK